MKLFPNSKDWRQPYRGSKAFDKSCRSKGGCPWCRSNRTIQAQRAVPADLKEQLHGWSGVEPFEPFEVPDFSDEWDFFAEYLPDSWKWQRSA